MNERNVVVDSLADTMRMQRPIANASAMQDTLILAKSAVVQKPTILTWPGRACGDRDDRPEPVTDVIRRS